MKFRCSFQHYSRRVCSRLLLAALCGLCHLNAQEIYIRANQIGYEPNATKIALAFCLGPLGNTFEILDAKTGKPLFHAQTQSVRGVRWGKFDQHVELDFSGFKQPGRYVVQLGDGRSLPFVIAPDIYAALPDQLLEFMRQQRLEPSIADIPVIVITALVSAVPAGAKALVTKPINVNRLMSLVEKYCASQS